MVCNNSQQIIFQEAVINVKHLTTVYEFTCAKLTVKTLEQGQKYVQS